MGYPIRINICHWERSNAENPDTESVVSKMEITAAYGKGFTARSILKLLATDSKIQSGQRQISRYVKRHICFLYPGWKFLVCLCAVSETTYSPFSTLCTAFALLPFPWAKLWQGVGKQTRSGPFGFRRKSQPQCACCGWFFCPEILFVFRPSEI